MRRAAVSVPSNVSEGLARKTPKEKINYLNISQGSLSELDTQLEIAYRLKYIAKNEFENINKSIIQIQKLLSGLSNKLNY